MRFFRRYGKGLRAKSRPNLHGAFFIQAALSRLSIFKENEVYILVKNDHIDNVQLTDIEFSSRFQREGVDLR